VVPPRSSIRRLFKNASIYGAGSFTASLIGLTIDPILSYHLTRADFGLLGLAAAVQGLLAATYTAGLDGAANRVYYEVETDGVAQRRAIGTLNTFLLGWVIVLTIAQEVFGPYLYALAFDGLPYHPYGRLVALALLLAALAAIPRALWAAREDVHRVVGLRVAASLLGAATLFALLFLTDLGPLGVLLAQVVAPALLIGVYIRYAYGTFGFAWDMGVLKQGLAFGLPMIVHLTSHWALNAVDRLLIESYLGREAVGLYSAAYKGLAILITINMAINGAYVPQFMRAHGKAEQSAFVGRVVTYFIAVASGASVAVVALAPSVLRAVYSERFVAAAPLLGIVCMGGLGQALYLVAVNGLFWARRTGRIPVYTLISALVNVGLNIWWIPHFGLEGAAWATVSSYVVLATLVYFGCRRITTIPYEPRLLRLILLGVVFMVGAWAADGVWSLGIEFAVKISIVLCFVPILAASGFFTAHERSWSAARARRWLAAIKMVRR